MSWGSLAVFSRLLVNITLLLAPSASLAAPVVINEIHYHARETEWKEDPSAEFVELYHSGDVPLSLEGWRFVSGIRFRFPRIILEPGGYAVVAADVEAFRVRHPDVPHVLGPFQGRLSNSGERLVLEDADEKVVDEVAYADSGRWARRVSTRLKGYDDWIWEAPHDGEGSSLSLRSPAAENEYGASWTASVAPGGTPGAKNDIFQENVAPVVVSVAHRPVIPDATAPVTVRAVVDHSSAVALSLHFRRDGETDFQSVPMAGGEGVIPPMAHGTVVQFYVHAEDGNGLRADYPELARDESGTLAKRQALCLYQVDNDFDPIMEKAAGRKPTYRLITTAAEIGLIRTLSGISGAGNAYDNRIHGTFIAVDGVETELRYQISARIRGHGSRSQFPPGLRLSFPSDAPWRGVTDINLNSQYTQSQSIGAAIHQLVGFAAARSTPVYLRMNGEDWTRSGSPQFGCYVHNEVFDSAYVDAHFPGEDEGNMYRLVGSANLNDRGSNLSNYRTAYSKRNHASEDDFSDLLQLIKTLAATQPAETYFDRVNEVVDLPQWARYLALDALLGNTEGGLSTGRGDDVAIIRRKDGRFHLVPYDLDSILGMGERGMQLDKGIYDYGNMQGLRQLFQDARFMKLYARQFVELTETVYKPEILNRLIDDQWQGWIPPDEIEQVKGFLQKRIEIVMSQIQSPTVIGSTLEIENGFHKASSPEFALYGRFDRGAVHDVLVGGRRPKLFSQTGTWIMPPDRLRDIVRPGMNQIPIVMRDTESAVVATEVLRVWLDNGAVQRVTGALPAGETIVWRAEDGPYLLEEVVSVPETSVLVIEAGTTVYGGEKGQLRVEGELKVLGEANRRVTFAPDPSQAEPTGWAGIVFQGAAARALRIAHADFFGLAGPIAIQGGQAEIHGVKIEWLGGQGIQAMGASLHLAGSELRQAAKGEGPLVEVSGGALELTDTTLFRDGAGPAVSLNAVPQPYIFGCRFQQPTAPVLTLVESAAFVDGNDFNITAKGGETPVISGGDAAALTRNRVFGSAILSLETADSADGNTRHARALPERVLLAADARFLREPPVKASDSRLRLEVGGDGLAAFRYRVDDAAWSDPIEMADKERQVFTLTDLQPGKHRVRLLGRHLSGRWQAESAATLSREFEVIPGLPSVVLSEVLAINEAAFSVDGEFFDYVELHNFGEQPFDLSGYGLSDDPDRWDAHVFPQGTVVEPNGYHLVIAHRDHAGFALKGQGETLVLSDPEGNAIDQVVFGLQLADHSISRRDDGRWELSAPTPGQVNRSIPTADPRALRFSEWFAVPSLSAPDEFIEVFNSADQPMAVGGFVITDTVPNERVWRPVPPLSYIGPGQRQIFLTDGDTDKGADHLAFRLAGEGEVIALFNGTGAMIDHIVFGPQVAGLSQGRHADGSLYYGPPSPGRESAGAAGDATHKLVEGIRISEIHYHPADDDDEEFIELINIANENLALDGLEFTGGIAFEFGEFGSAGLAPGARAVLVKDRRVFQNRYGDSIPIAGEYDGKLSNGGERLTLVTRDGRTVVEFDYSDKWHRSTDGRGYSLVLTDPKAARIDRKKAWMASEERGGTPGR